MLMSIVTGTLRRGVSPDVMVNSEHSKKLKEIVSNTKGFINAYSSFDEKTRTNYTIFIWDSEVAANAVRNHPEYQNIMHGFLQDAFDGPMDIRRMPVTDAYQVQKSLSATG